MKLTDTIFQLIVKWGGLVLLLSTVGNVYVLLRHREVYRDATRVEQQFQQQGLSVALKQQALEGVIKEFMARANADPNIAAILQRHTVQPGAKSAPAGKR